MRNSMMAEAAQDRTAEPGVPPEQRVRLLAGIAGFAPLPLAALERLAAICVEARYSAGSAVLREGDAADCAYLIVKGQAEVTIKSSSGPVPLAMLGPGELFGEIALLTPKGTRQATVTALTPLLCLSLPADAFRAAVAGSPGAAAAFQDATETMLRSRFLKSATPFTRLDREELARLSARLETLSVVAGDTIIRQGEPGDVCYLLRSGLVEVVREKDASATDTSAEDGPAAIRLATLRPGALFGEAALLTDAPRNATVRALEASVLLVLRRAHLLDAMGTEAGLAGQIVQLLHLRSRPRQVSGVTATDRSGPDGEAITILKNPKRLAYFRLSVRGRFLWDRLDGRRTLRDLALDYMYEFKAFAPQVVAEVLGGLAAAGFVTTSPLRTDVLEKTIHVPWWLRAADAARCILERQWVVRDIDGWVKRVYNGGVYLLYTRTGQALLAGIALAGLCAFSAVGWRSSAALRGETSGSMLLFLIPAFLLSVVLHEAGHAFTTKACGYEVLGAGVGWYWFSPIAFIDTSDIWRAGRRERIAVTLGGPYANIISGGIAALGSWFTASPVASSALWQLALVSYAMVLVNLNPLLEYDGYYVLIDWLDRPNLRSRAIAWLGQELRSGGSLAGHSLDLAYGIGAVTYIALMCISTVAAYRELVQPWFSHLVPAGLAAALAWAPGVALTVLSALSVAGELRGSRLAEAQ
jgi:putative peptide zinc metalloprotease protein